MTNSLEECNTVRHGD